jgi:hypothetical protein
MMRKLFLFGALCVVLISPSRAHDDDQASDWIGDHELKNANKRTVLWQSRLRRTAGRRRDRGCWRLPGQRLGILSRLFVHDVELQR